MKKILSVMLSLVMVMALLTGCGEKEESSSFFKEAAKLQDIQTGTSEMEFAMNLKGKEVKGDRYTPAILKNGDTVAFKIKVESTAESQTKSAVKISAQYGTNDYAELTTLVFDGEKLYLGVASIVDFIRSIDESVVAELESGLSQMGISDYISIDVKQLCEASNIEMQDMSKINEGAQNLTKRLFENLEKSFAGIQGKDGDDYTLTVGADNAEKVADALIQFCDEGSLKQTYNDAMDLYVEMFGADTEMGKQFAEMKNDTSELDNAVQEIKDKKEDIVQGLKDSKINAVAKINISGDEGSRVGNLSIDTGEIKDDDTTGRITVTSEVKEGEVSIQEMIPTEGVVDLTAMLTAMMNQTGAGLSGYGDTALY